MAGAWPMLFLQMVVLVIGILLSERVSAREQVTDAIAQAPNGHVHRTGTGRTDRLDADRRALHRVRRDPTSTAATGAIHAHARIAYHATVDKRPQLTADEMSG